MLCLSRKEGEKIVVGTGPTATVITIVEIGRNKVKVGIMCPRDVPVFREELLPIHAKPDAVDASEIDDASDLRW